MATVTLKNVYKIYHNLDKDGSSHPIKAVTDFNLDINDKEVIALVGPSGCGKTTTLRMIAGLESISKGEVYIDDTLINEVKPKDRGVAMVFQNYALYPHMTVYENVAFGLQPTDMPESEIRKKVDEVARILALDHLLARKPKELSGGQKQRVALGRALVRRNKIVLLDEPLSNLDAKLRASMRTELIKIHQKFESTFIYVTHNQEEAMTIADRIVVMREGIIQQVGAPEELYFNPCNLFVAAFLGAPMMNFANMYVIENNGDIYLSSSENDSDGEVRIKLPENKADKAGAYIGKEIIAGIRPEDLYAGDGAPQIDAEVEVREFIGDRIYLHCSIGQHPLTVRVSPDCKARRGDKIKIAVNPEKIYLFDKDTEKAICN